VAIIREADRDDVDGIARLHSNAREPRGGLGLRPMAGRGGGERWRSTVRSMVGTAGHIVLVADGARSGSLVGYAAATEVENAPFAVSRYGYVRSVDWEENEREPNLGIALYEALRDRLTIRGLRAAQTDVPPQDSAARGFWEARGFGSFLDRLWRPTGTEELGRSVSSRNVREARVSDSEVVLGLWAEMMDLHSALDERLSVVTSWRSQVGEMFRSWRRDPSCRVVVAEGPAGVVGFAVGTIEDPALGLELPRYGHIAHLCVSAQHRGQGVGHQLFDWLRGWFHRRGVRSIYLYVSSLNPASQRFWRGLGFLDYESRLWCYLT